MRAISRVADNTAVRVKKIKRQGAFMHTMFDKESHGKTIDALTAEFETDSERGLSAAEARRRLDSGGYNELKDRPRPGRRIS